MRKKKLRVSIAQPYLPHYSSAFFKRLQRRDTIENLHVLADLNPAGGLKMVDHDETIKLSHVPLVSRFGLVFRPGRFRIIRKYQPHVCILSADPRDVTSILLAVILRILGYKVVFWGMFHRIGEARVYSQIMYMIMGRVSNASITYARAGAQNLISLGIPAARVFIGGTAIDESVPFQAARGVKPQDIIEFKAQRGLLDKAVILQIVRLSKIKKPLLLLELASSLISRGRDNFIIVTVGEGEMLEEYIDTARKRNLMSVLHIAPSEYDENTLAKWFLSAEVFTIPTCVGLSAHHAFSYGIPIVTDDSIIEQASEFEIIQNGLNGLTYKSGDIEAYADAVEFILDNPDTRERMSKNAEESIVATYNLENKVNSFERVICHVADNTSAQ